MNEPARCPFCEANGAVLRHPLAYALYDKHPVTPGHLLIITTRHEANFFSTNREEREAMWRMAEQAKALLDAEFQPDGYNLGSMSARPPGRPWGMCTCI